MTALLSVISRFLKWCDKKNSAFLWFKFFSLGRIRTRVSKILRLDPNYFNSFPHLFFNIYIIVTFEGFCGDARSETRRDHKLRDAHQPGARQEGELQRARPGPGSRPPAGDETL